MFKHPPISSQELFTRCTVAMAPGLKFRSGITLDGLQPDKVVDGAQPFLMQASSKALPSTNAMGGHFSSGCRSYEMNRRRRKYWQVTAIRNCSLLRFD